MCHVRNHARFQNSLIHLKSSCSSITSMTLMAGNLCKLSASSSMSEFVIMKNFSITIHPPIPKCFKDVLWCPPQPGWVKVNIDEASVGNPIRAACGEMFRNHLGEHLDSFTCNFPTNNALFVEIMGAILAMEYAVTCN